MEDPKDIDEKASQPNPQSLNMVAAACYIPKDSIKRSEGEDAHFICQEKQTVGVADGVGSWLAEGIDSGIYARELMANCVTALDNQPKGNIHPKMVLTEAYLNTKAEGSSTACIITLTDRRFLRATHVGDSGFLLFRNNMIVNQSQAQKISFDCPFQLGMKRSPPECAIKTGYFAIPGDILVLGTGGLFDNLYPNQIESILREKNGEILKPEELARTISELAYNASMNIVADSPFARASQEAGKSHKGGKIDDITVVVAHIIESA
ncbi:hypothetical protein L6164_022670 [Bauhinia variegata]|uniref:Uncharacterized protein n=1 Tax=Bauhinia variegata TaxID=167791 RepID=A0ACB9MGC2_BAUVA|nr:hypothetical protein L6164_022670 [Bauhinia variegata]